jgi:hypothetical protein
MTPDTFFKGESPTLFRHGILVTNVIAKEDPGFRAFSGIGYALKQVGGRRDASTQYPIPPCDAIPKGSDERRRQRRSVALPACEKGIGRSIALENHQKIHITIRAKVAAQHRAKGVQLGYPVPPA